jgi:cytochrome c biogenesis protein CcmG/thiol:disulfide interchange protein DsbE
MRYAFSGWSAIAAAALTIGACSTRSNTAVKEQTATPAAEAAAEVTPTPVVPAAAPTGGAYVAEVTNVEKGAGDKVAPNFSWKGSDGKEHSLKEYRGKVVMLNFWATWCPPCRRELPDIIGLHKTLDPSKVAFIGVNVSEQAPEGTTIPAFVGKFASDKGITYPLVVANDDLAAAYGGINAVPTTFIISPDGKITDQFVGGRDGETFRKAIESSK